MTALLDVNGLSKRFGGLQAVSDLSFTVEAGEILALIGPNGAGKSTVFDLINGIHPPDSGRIVFDGQDITGKPPHEIAHRGLARAHQIVQPLPELSVLDNCLVGACYGRGDLSLAAGRALVREVADLVELADRLEMPAGQLTTAGKKRLELARALCGLPRLLLLDEVLAGLNLTEIARMVETIKGIRARGVAILMVEHVMTAIMSLSDRIVVLNLGRKLAQGTPRQIADDPAVVEAYLGNPEFLLADKVEILMVATVQTPAPLPVEASGQAPAQALLTVQSLEAGYGDVQVLWGISLGVAQGGMTTLIGSNGAGKTTTLRAVMGSIVPQGGRVLFAGEDVTKLAPHAKAARGLVLVPEGRQLFSEMSVEENLEMGAYSRRARRRAADRLEQVYTLFPRLKERRRQKAGTFSGGEQQMLAIGRGLMSDPLLLIIDELSLGLAPVVVQLLMTKLHALKQTGLTILLVEQNVHLALALSDYAYVIAEGRPFADGPSAKVAAMGEIRQAYLGL